MVELKPLNYAGMLVGSLVILGSLIFLNGNPIMMFLIIIGAIIAAFPFLLNLLDSQKKKKEKESKFLEFIRDLVENVKTGAPISKAIINLRKRNYGGLTPHVAKLSNQLSIGMTLTESLTNFANDINSKVVSRAVGLVSEAEKAGGQIETILEAVANSINQIETLGKERKASISNLVTQGYIIFMVFIIIMLVLEFKILPMVTDLGGAEGIEGDTPFGAGGGGGDQDFGLPLFLLLIVQSFFAGLVIGKISEGSVKDGIKHSFILLALTLLIKSGANALFGVPGA